MRPADLRFVVADRKPIRETLNADLPLTVDHFRYFAGCVRAQEGALSEIDPHTIAYHFHEPLDGKSPNIFFDDVLAADDAFLDKAIEGPVLFAFNQGESAPVRVGR